MSDYDGPDRRTISNAELLAELRIIKKDVEVVAQQQKDTNDTLEKYVTKMEFGPVKWIAYGFAIAALTGVTFTMLSNIGLVTR